MYLRKTFQQSPRLLVNIIELALRTSELLAPLDRSQEKRKMASALLFVTIAEHVYEYPVERNIYPDPNCWDQVLVFRDKRWMLYPAQVAIFELFMQIGEALVHHHKQLIPSMQAAIIIACECLQKQPSSLVQLSESRFMAHLCVQVSRLWQNPNVDTANEQKAHNEKIDGSRSLTASTVSKNMEDDLAEKDATSAIIDPTNATCPKCAKAFITPSKLRRHLARKTPCESVVACKKDDRGLHRCMACNRTFTTKQAKSRHINERCKMLT